MMDGKSFAAGTVVGFVGGAMFGLIGTVGLLAVAKANTETGQYDDWFNDDDIDFREEVEDDDKKSDSQTSDEI